MSRVPSLSSPFLLGFDEYVFLSFWLATYFEEAELVQRFGQAYRDYQKRGIYFINNPGKTDINRISQLYKLLLAEEIRKLDNKYKINDKINYVRYYRKVDRRVWLKIKDSTGLEYYWKGF